ncbi:hypothetical protein HZA73_09380 [candidate division TA06 bacterium]|nr:hypothetical protein [candidate division TA06 bacterium]
MRSLNCTRKLADHLGLSISPDEPEQTPSILGDWTVTYFLFGDQTIYLFVNNDTLFSFTSKNVKADNIKTEFLSGLVDALYRAGTPFEKINMIHEEYCQIAIAKNTNKRILGSINNLIYHYDYTMRRSLKNGNTNLDAVEAKMIKLPFKYLSYKYPIELLKAKLGRGS